MRKLLITALIFGITISLSGCNLPASEGSTPTADVVSTQVAVLLTAQPSGTPGPTQTAQPTSLPPQATLVPAETSTPTTMGVLSPTPSAQDPAVYLGSPTSVDTLDSGKSFGLDATGYDDDYTSIHVENGALVLTSRYATGYRGWRTGGPKVKNAYTEATIQVGECSGTDLYGLIVRSPDFIKGYWFQVTCEGNWAYGYWDGENYVELSASSNPSSSVLTGSNQINRLGVLASGENYKLFINGQQVGEVNDGTFTEAGSYGMLITSRNTPNFTIYTQEFKVWKLQ